MTLGDTLGKSLLGEFHGSQIQHDSRIANHRSSLTVTCYFAAFLLSSAYAKTKHKDLKERSGLPSTLGRYAVLPA